MRIIIVIVDQLNLLALHATISPYNRSGSINGSIRYITYGLMGVGMLAMVGMGLLQGGGPSRREMAHARRQYLRHLAMWRRALPDSYYPDLLEAELYQLWAWTVRGHGTASQITQQAWALFSYRNEMAQASLDDSGDSARRDPLWCYLSMRLQHDRAHDIEPIEQTYRKCIAQFPRYASLHGSMLRSLMPRWYGSSQKVAEFIENMAAAQPAEQQDAMYAQLYWTYADLEGDDTNIFEESGADWERIDKGFDSLQEQYPQSDVVLNAHARFACIARDDVIFRWLRTQLRGRRSASAWTKKTTLEGCSTGMFYWNLPAPARQ